MSLFFKGGLTLAALVLFFGYLWSWPSAGAVGQEKQEKKGAPPAVSSKELAHAKTVFGERCARCHGVDGRSQTVIGGMLGAPDFTKPEWWKDNPGDERLTNSITNGKDGMPGFGKKLSRQEIISLAAYVRRFNKTRR
jgi:mono/diheme cytochrome c family protein